MSDDGFTTHLDTKPLLDFVLQSSMDAIKKYGELAPRAVTMAPDGQMSFVAAAGENSLEMLADLFEGLKEMAQAGSCKATCVAYDIRLRQPRGRAVDAICIDIEHLDAGPARLVVPYERGWFGKTTFHPIAAHDPHPRIFASEA